MITENKLLDLDFRPGIRDDDIDYNFQVVKGWIDRARLRLGGWGIVEGFEFSKDLPGFNVHISDGVFINEQGEEIAVAEHTEHVGPPTFQKQEEKVVVGADGTIVLKHSVYSDNLKACAWYVPPEHMAAPLSSELKIKTENGDIVTPLNILNNVITVNLSYAGLSVTVDYLYSNDRTDAVFIAKDGSSFLYQKGMLSTAPSSPELDQYRKDYYLLGFCLWTVDTTEDVTFITFGRDFARVYVDNQNRLFLNGELYKKSKFIYFIKPESPEENDIWCDENNNLWIWREKNGTWGWWPVNDRSSTAMRQVYQFQKEQNPDDLQTFLFPESEHIEFVPGMNELEIVIDNTPLMSDQFTEVVEKGMHDYEDRGIGFKLIEPMDEKRIVEVIIHHSVKSAAQRETFQRMAIFTEENWQAYNANENKVFYTDVEYEAGEGQLEVWLEGKRLRRGAEWVETINGTDVTSSDKGKLTKSFRIVADLANEQIVSYKITRHMWSYENLQKIVDTITEHADAAYDQSQETKTEMATLTENTQKKLDDLQHSIDTISIPDISGLMKKTDIVSKSQLSDDIRTFGNTFHKLVSASAMTVLDGITTNDYLNVFYQTPSVFRILFYGTDYTVEEQNGVYQLVLNSQYVSSDPSIQLYITGIHFSKGGES